MQHTSAAAATLGCRFLCITLPDYASMHSLLLLFLFPAGCHLAPFPFSWRMAASPCFARGHILQSSNSLVTVSRFVRAVFLVALAMSEVDMICLAQQASCCTFLKSFSKFLFAFNVSLCWVVLQQVPAFWLETVKCNRGKLHKIPAVQGKSITQGGSSGTKGVARWKSKWKHPSKDCSTCYNSTENTLKKILLPSSMLQTYSLLIKSVSVRKIQLL